MMPRQRKPRIHESGETGVRFPRHVGTWTITDVFERETADGKAVHVYRATHDQYLSARPCLFDGAGRTLAILGTPTLADDPAKIDEFLTNNCLWSAKK